MWGPCAGVAAGHAARIFRFLARRTILAVLQDVAREHGAREFRAFAAHGLPPEPPLVAVELAYAPHASRVRPSIRGALLASLLGLVVERIGLRARKAAAAVGLRVVNLPTESRGCCDTGPFRDHTLSARVLCRALCRAGGAVHEFLAILAHEALAVVICAAACAHALPRAVLEGSCRAKPQLSMLPDVQMGGATQTRATVSACSAPGSQSRQALCFGLGWNEPAGQSMHCGSPDAISGM